MALAVYGTLAQSGTLTRLANLVSQLQDQLANMDPFVTTWTDAENLTHTVTTHRDGTETMAEWADRHKAAVDALKAVFPPASE